jgi:hypothetical protein
MTPLRMIRRLCASWLFRLLAPLLLVPLQVGGGFLLSWAVSTLVDARPVRVVAPAPRLVLPERPPPAPSAPGPWAPPPRWDATHLQDMAWAVNDMWNASHDTRGKKTRHTPGTPQDVALMGSEIPVLRQEAR